MTRLPAVLSFIALTFLCWGTYGPVLHIGQEAMDRSRWRPFICVGVAYFLIAVIYPWIALRRETSDQGRWTVTGIIWSLSAGIITAIGALGIILAFNFGGRPVYVMPLVFGGSPVVNTLVTMLMTGTHKQTRWPFYAAVLLVAFGAAGVFLFKPILPTPSEPPAEARFFVQPSVQVATGTMHYPTTNGAAVLSDPVPLTPSGTSTRSGPGWQGAMSRPIRTLAAASSVSDAADAKESTDDEELESPKRREQPFKVFLAILTTVLCWGSYGPLLHRGQVKMQNSRLRPFMCVGMAYFAIAVIIPSFILVQYGEIGEFSFFGTLWSLVAGVLGAFGSLGIILAFTAGGRPVYVMPLVFGMAPVVNTFTSMMHSLIRHGTVGTIRTEFYISLAMVIVGAVSVLIFAPKPTPKEKAPSVPAEEPPPKPAIHSRPPDEPGAKDASGESSDDPDAAWKTDWDPSGDASPEDPPLA